ncbi:hypothetical protein [Cryobacterium roopkundense]|uniref:Uncharacterized protein n=1 Tax=Cryobacterium roopkundense TaxID=1001240 RepID=A0A7W9A0W5_9MICO|nr:hypothetical protein [Cryobacterium roopkundense]MBB5643550.1 hypothetical protein [Cryobacterium roopkundense]
MAEVQGLGLQGEAFNALGKVLFGMLADGDDRIEYSASMTAPVTSSDVMIFNATGQFETPDGRVNSSEEPDELYDALKALRAACYRPGTGTWFSIRVVVLATGAGTAEYNYDNEPDFGLGGIDPICYVTDQDRFPRDEDKQPEWLKLRLAEGRAGIAARGQ